MHASSEGPDLQFAVGGVLGATWSQATWSATVWPRRPPRASCARCWPTRWPPLVVGVDGSTRFLDDTGTGPLGTGSTPALAGDTLAPGEPVLLCSDGESGALSWWSGWRWAADGGWVVRPAPAARSWRAAVPGGRGRRTAGVGCLG
ncbi:hypothetical protein [Geodermatophilus sp. URMC 63]